MQTPLTTGDMLGIGGIVATIIVGVTIFYMQQRADSRINRFITGQHQIIHHEDDRKKSIKRYFIRRVNADFESFKGHYNDLKQKIQQYRINRSDESWTDLKRFTDNFFIGRVDSFVTVTSDINLIVPLLDNPRLIDKYSLIITYGGQFKEYARELSDSQYRRNEDFMSIENVLDTTMNSINELMDLLLKEVDYKLD